jgi:CBS domain containing-hemolysin-like protein
LGEPAVSHLLAPGFQLLSINNPALISSLSVIIGFVIITLLHVVFGELVPKTMSIQKAEKAVLALALPMRFFYILWYPVVSVMNGISRGVLHLIGFGTASEAEQSHSPEELRLLIVNSRKGGTLEDSEGRMLDNIFGFYKKTAKEIMLHRNDVTGLRIDDSMGFAVNLAKTSSHTRFPVYDANREGIVGFIHAKDLLRQGDTAKLADIVRPPIYVYETMHLDNLLRLMQEKRQQFCAVIDEYGVWQGIVTMEDIVEVIVGDIQDEFDNEEPEFVPQPDGSVIISADLSLDELSGRMNLVCTDPDINAHAIIASHIIDRLGRIPVVGDSIRLCDKIFTVAAMDRHRVRRVRVQDDPESNGEKDTS